MHIRIDPHAWKSGKTVIENIHAYEIRLARKLVDGFREIGGVVIYCCDDMVNHLSTVMINVDGMDAGNVGIMLDVEFNIATRTGLHCAPLVHKQINTLGLHGGVRFSIGAFNTDEQVNCAIEAITEIAVACQSLPC